MLFGTRSSSGGTQFDHQSWLVTRRSCRRKRARWPQLMQCPRRNFSQTWRNLEGTVNSLDISPADMTAVVHNLVQHLGLVYSIVGDDAATPVEFGGRFYKIVEIIRLPCDKPLNDICCSWLVISCRCQKLSSAVAHTSRFEPGVLMRNYLERNVVPSTIKTTFLIGTATSEMVGHYAGETRVFLQLATTCHKRKVF